jgi:hypothetical protein
MGRARKAPKKPEIRPRAKRVFGGINRLSGFPKRCYRGLAKNATRSFVALGLVNIFLSRERLVVWVRPNWAHEAPDGCNPGTGNSKPLYGPLVPIDQRSPRALSPSTCSRPKPRHRCRVPLRQHDRRRPPFPACRSG